GDCLASRLPPRDPAVIRPEVRIEQRHACERSAQILRTQSSEEGVEARAVLGAVAVSEGFPGEIEREQLERREEAVSANLAIGCAESEEDGVAVGKPPRRSLRIRKPEVDLVEPAVLRVPGKEIEPDPVGVRDVDA